MNLLAEHLIAEEELIIYTEDCVEVEVEDVKPDDRRPLVLRVNRKRIRQDQASHSENSKAKPPPRRAKYKLRDLTLRFYDLLQHNKNSQLNIEQAAELLGLQNEKRRIYDVTNVLLGIGIIEKYNGRLQWTIPSELRALTIAEQEAKLEEMKETISQLQEKENELDEQIKIAEQELKKVLEENLDYLYSGANEMIEAFPEKTQFIVRAGPKMELLVPEAKYGQEIRSRVLLVKAGSAPLEGYYIDCLEFIVLEPL